MNKYLFPFILSLFLIACQKSTTSDLQEAQLCLDKATASQAQACVAKISSDTSENGFKLKCAAIFISEGFTSPTSFTSALDQINTPANSHGCTGDCSSTLAVLNSFNFSSGDNTQVANRNRNLATATSAFTNCSLSGVKIYAQISSLFKLGTMLLMVTPAVTSGGTATVAQLQTAVNSMTPSEVGSVVTTTYQSTCTNQTNQSDATKKYCTELATAFNSGATATDIGSCLIKKLNNPSATCP